MNVLGSQPKIFQDRFLVHVLGSQVESFQSLKAQRSNWFFIQNVCHVSSFVYNSNRWCFLLQYKWIILALMSIWSNLTFSLLNMRPKKSKSKEILINWGGEAMFRKIVESRPWPNFFVDVIWLCETFSQFFYCLQWVHPSIFFYFAKEWMFKKSQRVPLLHFWRCATYRRLQKIRINFLEFFSFG